MRSKIRFQPSLRRVRTLLLATFAVLSSLAATPSLQAKTVLIKAGGEQQVNVQTVGDQGSPAIAADARGNYAIAWLGPDELFRIHLYVRLFDASGAPRSGEIVIDDEAAPFEDPRNPRLAMAADGRFAVLWTANHAWLRQYSPQGAPSGQRIRTDDTSILSGTDANLAMRPDGAFLVTWLGVDPSLGVYARSFDAEGQPLESGRRLESSPSGSISVSPRALFLSGGEALVSWVKEQSPLFLMHDSQIVAVQRSTPDGPWSPETELVSRRSERLFSIAPVALPEGGFSVVWSGANDALPPANSNARIFARRFTADGVPATPILPLPFSNLLAGNPAAAADAYGNTLVIASHDFAVEPKGRLFDRDWNPIGTEAQIVSFEGDVQHEMTVSAAGDGFVAAWSSGTTPPIFFPFPPSGPDGYGFGIFAQRFGPSLCAEGSKVLCLGADGRFELSTAWKTPAGAEGTGRAHPLTSDTGAFWFFEPSNLELLTKVLDGRTTNDHFWVFSGALSDVDYTLTVRDSATGASRSYHNPQGTLASRADTEAFAGSDGAPAPVTQGTASGAPEVSRGNEKTTLAAPCDAGDPSVLCLALAGGFRIRVDFVDPRTGLHGAGQAVALTADSGAFTFFDAANLELVFKMLDGGAVNSKVWVFYGGLSNVEYTITVQNVSTGAVRTYTNPRGALESKADTRAFDATFSAPL